MTTTVMTTATLVASVTLAERILAITAEIPKIKPSGKSPFSKEPALSIGDVEDAVRPLLVKHGLLIHFQTRHLIAPSDGHREWVAEITANVVMGKEGFMADWADSGGTPAAAYSFARKSYLKQLFHIADGEDAPVAPPTAGTTRERVVAPSSPAANGGKPRVLSREPTGRVCPECGGDLEVVTWDNGQSKVTCTNWKQEDGACRYREAVVVDQTPIPF